MKSIAVKTDSVTGVNDRFWAASGIDELFAFIKTEEGEFLTDRMAKKGTCRYIRNHFTLNREIINGARCGGDVYSEDAEGNPLYDFEWINDVFRRAVSKGIKPIVELDYMPDLLIGESGGVTQEGLGHKQGNRYYPNHWGKWEKLLKAFVQNLADTFGLEEIRTWYFEVWNEPDNWPVEEWNQFHRLYDVFAHAVKSVDPALKVGGPACFKMSFFRSFLNHVENGINYVTGEKGVALDFISYHIYGMSGAWLKKWPLVMPTVQRFVQELLWIQREIRNFPSLQNTEFMLNEWGVISNYERSCKDYPPLEIRNSEYSGLFSVKLVDCLQMLRREYSLPLSVLLYWGFSNEDNRGVLFNGNRSLTTANHICKPVQTAHEFLAMLGDETVKTEGLLPGGDEGVMATQSKDSAEALVYYFNECDTESSFPNRDYRLNFTGLDDGCYKLSVYTMDNTHNNTYRLWQRMGCPETLSAEEKEALSQEQEVTADVTETVEVKQGSFSYDVSLPGVSMKLVTLTKM